MVGGSSGGGGESSSTTAPRLAHYTSQQSPYVAKHTQNISSPSLPPMLAAASLSSTKREEPPFARFSPSSSSSSSMWERRTLVPLHHHDYDPDHDHDHDYQHQNQLQLHTEHHRPSTLHQPLHVARRQSPQKQFHALPHRQDGIAQKSPPMQLHLQQPSVSNLQESVPRRNRSVSEVMPGLLHTVPSHQRRSHAQMVSADSSVEALQPPILPYSTASSSTNDRIILPPPPKAGGLFSNAPAVGLPPLTRFSANIRRSNTLSAIHGTSTAPYGVTYQPLRRSTLSRDANMSGGPPTATSPTGGGGAIAQPSRLASPHRIFSRKFSDASRTSTSTLPPLVSTGSSLSGGGGAGSSTATLLSPSSTSSAVDSNAERALSLERTFPASVDGEDVSPRKHSKSHVASACLNCKKAHLACDVSRPCRRCINLGKTDTCVDVRHKKRGRPRLRDRETSAQSLSTGGIRSAHGSLTTAKSRGDEVHIGMPIHFDPSIPPPPLPPPPTSSEGMMITNGPPIPTLPPYYYHSEYARGSSGEPMYAMHASASMSHLPPHHLRISSHGENVAYGNSPPEASMMSGQSSSRAFHAHPYATDSTSSPHANTHTHLHTHPQSHPHNHSHGRGRSFSAVNPPTWDQDRQHGQYAYPRYCSAISRDKD